jgi:hypothetical protein
MRLFFLTIPKPLRQHPILKKIIHAAIFNDLGVKLSDSSAKQNVWQSLYDVSIEIFSFTILVSFVSILL